MASFPNTIFSPASKNTGDTIQASHVTDLDGEVVAIEQGLRNGTAPLNSSNSTFASVVCSSLFSAPAQPRCAVYSTVSSTQASSIFVGVAFPSQDFNVGGMHSTSANSSIVTIGSSGTYALTARIHKSPGGSTSGTVALLVNGLAVASRFYPTSLGETIYISHHARLQAGDAVGLAVQTTDTSATVFNAGGGGTETRLEVVRLY